MGTLRSIAASARKMGAVEKSFVAALVLYVVLRVTFPNGSLQFIAGIAAIVLGFWIAIRLARKGIRTAIWRLRNRLLVTYLFIAVVPVLLIVTLAGLGAYALASQIAVYLATSEIDRKVAAMQTATETLSRTEPPLRPEVMHRLGDIYESRYPGVTMLVQDQRLTVRWPKDSALDAPAGGWGNASGVAWRAGRYYAWSNVVQKDVRITAFVPLTRRYLSEMVPGLGEVYFVQIESRDAVIDSGSQTKKRRGTDIDYDVVSPFRREPSANTMPAPVNRFDIAVQWPSVTPVSDLDTAGKTNYSLLLVRTRFSALLGIISSRKVDVLQGLLPFLVAAVAILFLIVELVALVIGVSLTRTITRAVHSLYEGTQLVMHGDFAHRIQVVGRDQLAELGTSFNSMTENVQRLLAVAKEKERLQAEIAIAREVQEQLYPKAAPAVKSLCIAGFCEPARMVSGDYYDFQRVRENQVAIAIGDVAGKGISAALLMATIQAAMRIELRSAVELAAPSHQPANGFRLSTARVVSDLNQQLYATTSPEKFATFYFSLYDESSGTLSYTNAGHLPPLLIRNGRAERLDVNGIVVGAFPFARYEQSQIQLEAGDLLVCYTDGITEPENEYGEMFGEDRLIDLVCKNADCDEKKIIELVMDAVHQWTRSPELQDDMTVLLARKQ